MAYEKINEYEKAVAILNEVLNMNLGPKEGWKAIPDLKKHAFTWMKVIAERKGDTELLGQLKDLEGRLFSK